MKMVYIDTNAPQMNHPRKADMPPKTRATVAIAPSSQLVERLHFTPPFYVNYKMMIFIINFKDKSPGIEYRGFAILWG